MIPLGGTFPIAERETIPAAQPKLARPFVCGYSWCQGHTSEHDKCLGDAAHGIVTDSPTLEDLYDKISGFPELLQEQNLPMLSKAATLAQIASAQSLERIAAALEFFQQERLDKRL
jgi:hypothetical protein